MGYIRTGNLHLGFQSCGAIITIFTCLALLANSYYIAKWTDRAVLIPKKDEVIE